MPLAQAKIYTEEDYYNLPENVRAELIEGKLIYNQAAPSRIHQTIQSVSCYPILPLFTTAQSKSPFSLLSIKKVPQLSKITVLPSFPTLSILKCI